MQKKRINLNMAKCARKLARRIRFLAGSTRADRQSKAKKHKQKNELQYDRKMDFLSALAGGVTHEFNNILGIILGNAEAAMEELPFGNAVRSNLIEIKNASLRGKRVGRQILLVLDNSSLEKTPLVAKKCMNGCLGLLRAIIPEGIDIKIELRCQDETIMANVAEFDQLLINLCTNAVSAMAHESGVIRIGLKSVRLNAGAAAVYDHLPPGDYVKLSVADTGCGINPAIYDRIFDPYFTTSKEKGDLGIGLAVVKSIVNHCDGSIRVRSQPGKGTTVEVLFPLFSQSPSY